MQLPFFSSVTMSLSSEASVLPPLPRSVLVSGAKPNSSENGNVVPIMVFVGSVIWNVENGGRGVGATVGGAGVGGAGVAPGGAGVCIAQPKRPMRRCDDAHRHRLSATHTAGAGHSSHSGSNNASSLPS